MQRKTIFITGASSGIGFATTTYLLENGWNVIATMRNIEAVKSLKSSSNLLVQQVDVTDSDSIQKAFDEGIRIFGKIDAILNNAGYGLLGPLENTTEEQVHRQFSTNVYGIINTIRVALPHFRKNKTGKILNVSSMMGRITLPFMRLYIASKFAVEGLSEDLYYELKPFGVQVKLIEPGSIRTNFFTTSLVKAENNAIKAYDSYWLEYINNMIERGNSGEDPIVAAKVILKALNDDSDRLRYTVDRIAKLLLLLRSSMPLRVFQFLIQKFVR